MIHVLLRNGADCSQGELEEWDLRGRPRTLLEMFDETEYDEDDDDDGNYDAKARALLVGVAAAGSWKKYLHEPRVRLDTLRVLCARGRAVPPSGPLARLFPLWGGGVPLGVFRTILCFWHSDRDELPCCEESAPFLSYRRSRGNADLTPADAANDAPETPDAPAAPRDPREGPRQSYADEPAGRKPPSCSGIAPGTPKKPRVVLPVHLRPARRRGS